MNPPLLKAFGVFAVIPLLVSACGGQTLRAQAKETSAVKVMNYGNVLGKHLHNQDVADFVTNNHCASENQYQICKDAGMAFWTDSDLVVQTVYLYSGNADGFRRYRGELPYSLTFYDPMWRVQQKLIDPDSDDVFQQAGLPDETASPDYVHYRAIYRRLGITVIYNSPGYDEDAYIYAIVLSQ